MGDPTIDKAGWLDQIEREREAWKSMVTQAEERGLDQPGAAGDWTFKDVAGHLNGWRRRTVDRLEAAARDEAPPPMPWPSELSEETDEGIEAINSWIYERNRDRPAAEILAESDEQLRRMRAAVETIPEHTLLTPGLISGLDGESLSVVLEGSFGHLHEEHEPAIRAWLANRTP